MSNFWRRALSAALASFVALCSAPMSALAQQVPAHTAVYHSTPVQTGQPAAGGQAQSGGWTGSPVNLNLSSTAATISAPSRLVQNPVNIMVGGISQAVTAGQKLTPAEMIAVSQVLRTGTQSLQLNSNGAASGGSLVIGQRLSQHIASLVVPQGVTLIDRASTLSLTGNLSNAGNMYVISNNPAVTTANITAANIFNQQGALISSILPSGGLAGVINAMPNVNLSLNALNNIVNAGTISSSGHLTLTAGGSITNALPPGTTGPSPLLQALNNVNLNASGITNSGLIASIAGNINVAAFAASGQAAQALNINNTGGAFQALNGAINIGSSQYGTATNISLTGGDWLSRELNLYAGAGNVNVDAGNVTGVVNVEAGCAHLLTAAPDLNIGTLNISGDPSVYNNLGSVTLSNLSFTADLAIVAGQDITVGNSTGGITTAPGSGQPGDVTLIAGANFLSPLPLQNVQSPPDSSTTIIINGPSVTGGSVQVPGSISSSGGSVLLVAYSGSGAGSTLAPGTINIGGNITTPGVNSVNNLGSVTLIAGTNSGNAITVGNITTSNASASGNGGAVNLFAATPFINGGTLSITNGTPSTPLPFATTGLTMTKGSISAGNLLTAGTGGSGSSTGIGGGGGGGGAVTIEGAGPITVGFVRTFGGGGGGGPTGGPGGQGGAVTIGSFNGTVTITGDVNTSGGGGGGSSNSSVAGGPGGGAGSVSIGSPNAAISIAGPVLAAGGGAGGSNNAPLPVGGGGGGGSFGGAGGGAGNPDNGGSVESFGTGESGTGTGSAGFNVGTLGSSGAGGAVTMVAPSVTILGTVASLGFSASPFAGESVNASGAGGSLNISATGFSPVYFADANLGPNANTYPAAAGGFFSAGTLDAGVGANKPIIINGAPVTQSLPNTRIGGSPATILEGLNTPVLITPGTLITPAEQIAYVQVASGGQQTLALSGTGAGTGFATASSTSTPSSFTVSAQNIPTGDFTNLVLPAGVTENVATQSIKYNGQVSVSGTLAFTSNGSTLIGGSGAVIVTPTGTVQSSQDLTINVTAGGSFTNNGNVQSKLNTQIFSTNSLIIAGQGNFSSAASGFVKLAADTLIFGNSLKQTTVNSTFVLAANTIVGPTDASIASLIGNVTLSSGSSSTTEFAVGTGATQSVFSLGDLSFFNVAQTVQIDKNVTVNVASLSTASGPPSNLIVNGTLQSTGIMAFSDGLYITMGAGSAISTTSSLQFGLNTRISGGPASGTLSGANVQFASGILSVDIASISGIISGIGPPALPPTLAAGSVTIKTGSGNLTFAAAGVDTSAVGGPIDIEANGGSIGGQTAGSPPSFTTTLASSNGAAGTVTLIAPGGISVGNIDARGLSGANGGTISITTTSLNANGTISTSGTGTITVQSNSSLNLNGTATFQTDAAGSTSFLAMAAGQSISIGDSLGEVSTQLLVAGGAPVNIRTPNLLFLSTAAQPNPVLRATTASAIAIDSGNSAANVNLTITGTTGNFQGNIGTGGGTINISPTGTGSLTFSQTITGSPTGTAIFLSGGNVAINDVNAITIDRGVTVQASNPVSISMNTSSTAPTPAFTNNGTLATAATGSGSPTLLIQNSLSSLILAGTGTINGSLNVLTGISGSVTVSSGASITATGGIKIATNNLTNLGTVIARGSLSTGGGMLITDAGQHIQGTMAVTGPGTFTASSDTITFSPSANSITFSNSLFLNGTATGTSAAVTINDGTDLGVTFSPNSSLTVTGGDGRVFAVSPVGQSLNISGSGTLADSQLVLTATGQGANINLTGTPVLTFASAAFLSATGGAVKIVSGTVAHSGGIVLNTSAPIPSGFSPASGIQQLNPTQTPPSPAGATLLILTDPLVDNGNLAATSTAGAGGPGSGPGGGPGSGGGGGGSGGGGGGGAGTSNSLAGVSLTGGTTTAVTSQNFSTANSNSQANLDSQLSTRVSTDFTPFGDTPEQKQTNNVTLNANGTPYEVPGSTESGWQATIDSSGNQVWSCPGCLSSNPDSDEHSSTQNATRVLERVSEKVDGKSSEPLYVADAQTKAPIPPFSSGTHPIPARGGASGSGGTGLHPAANGKDFDFYSLLKGMALFNAGANVVVATVEGDVHISKGSLAYVYETGHDVSIYNLHDRRTGAVSVIVGKTVVIVPPGKQLVLTKKEDAGFDEVNPGAKISYRNPKPLKLPDGVKGFIADFSIPSAIFGLPPLRAMLTSAKPAEKAAAYQLLKNAVIMADVYAALGPYQAKK